MNKDLDFKYDGIGFNGPHLAKMSYPAFREKVKHHFEGPDGEAKMTELHAKLVEKWPQPAIAKPPATGQAKVAGPDTANAGK